MRKTAVLTALGVLAGCGSSLAPADVSSFEQRLAAATATLGAYEAATQGMTTDAGCTAAVNGYATPMRDDLDRMTSISTAMDDRMRSMGEPAHADVRCGMNGMDEELRHHLEVACRSSEMAANRAEAMRHVGVMADVLEHMQMRAAEVSSMQQGMGPEMMDGGWHMHDGGVMDWDDHPPGCMGAAAPDGGMPHGGMP